MVRTYGKTFVASRFTYADFLNNVLHFTKFMSDGVSKEYLRLKAMSRRQDGRSFNKHKKTNYKALLFLL